MPASVLRWRHLQRFSHLAVRPFALQPSLAGALAPVAAKLDLAAIFAKKLSEFIGDAQFLGIKSKNSVKISMIFLAQFLL